jgi:hypothetical protein
MALFRCQGDGITDDGQGGRAQDDDNDSLSASELRDSESVATKQLETEFMHAVNSINNRA